MSPETGISLATGKWSGFSMPTTSMRTAKVLTRVQQAFSGERGGLVYGDLEDIA